MDLPGRTVGRKNGLINLLRQRETLESGAHVVPQKAHVTENLISRLGLEGELEGHAGCVNCLEWNDSGTILASSSDDMKLCLWDPFRKEMKLQHPTGHDGNVFSVKFMPKSNDKIVVTGAGDNCVIVHEVSVPGTILHCRCHAGRVKRIATENVPNLFWTASEDGTVMEYDLRTEHYCKPSRRDHFRVLVDLVSHAGRKAEAKCLAVNPMKPEMIAVGANDPYVRLYDRRMIKLGRIPLSANEDWARISPDTAGKGDPDNNVPLGCAQYFIPGHLRAPKFRNNGRNFTTTYLTFSADGNELLVNMGGEQIYLFDVEKEKSSRSFQCSSRVPRTPLEYSGYSPERLLTERIFGHRYFSIDADSQVMSDEKVKKSAYGFDFESCDLSSMNVSELPMDVENLKQEANAKFQDQQYACAISIYNKALLLCPKAAVLYANRAATFMKRRWDGDIYAALRDCQTTLLLDPEHVKAHFRLARCLHDLARHLEANKVLEDFRTKFPEYSMNSSHRALRKDIKEVLETLEDEDAHVTPMSTYIPQISDHEAEWRINTIDYKLRFCGHCNTTTDIKEANFFGNNGQYIVAGSDDGSFFIWDRYTTNIVRVLRGDDRIVNCLQPHPSTCLLATSGIDPVIRLWSPLPEDGKTNERNVPNPYEAAMANQDRMNSDPFELMMLSMGYRFPVNVGEEGEEQEDSRVINPDSCRTS